MLALALTLITTTMTQSWSISFLILPILFVYSSTFLFSPMSTPISLSPMFTMDTMSVSLIMLTIWITNLMMLVSSKIKWTNNNPNMFISSSLSLCIILILSFSINSMLSFYILFEASLIPTLIIILTWGYQPERLEAGMYLMIYTITASLPLLASIMFLFKKNGTIMFYMPYDLTNPTVYLSVALTLAFLIKMPMYLTHLWLPKAHVEAPAAGSMILASILLKLGSYGLLRMMTMFPTYMTIMSKFVIPISLWGAGLITIMCLRQLDLKSMIAYSSVSHMALVITGIATMNSWGWEGALTMMIAHGLISSGLFALANMYYENTHSRSLLINNGLLLLTPSMAFCWFLTISANMAAPPFINLLAEIILLTSAISFSMLTMVPIMISAMFTVCYSMILYTSLHHGKVNPSLKFINILPSYFTITLCHILPCLILILSSNQITSWT
uniref:NADH-ubiquinone oxidoreductase chain 4 n=1 Tax=Typosyllis antoni TaxID=1898412 RepID=A0A1C9UZF2_9ANNE|nr:NADH dehydrogenase subunit 4 [Typosyllis antoni]AOR87157.1 NADH dehydrogenase subunit 4 [Typosyllis antoni]